MIETPAAVVIADRLAEVSAFFSVGTNDLTQYTLAVDRGNARLADRFTPHHPAVVRQLQQMLDVGGAAGLPVSVCGEMASEPLSVVLLIGLGLPSLSVGAARAAAGEVGGPHGARGRRAGSGRGVAAGARRRTRCSTRSARRSASYVDLRLLDPHAALPGRARVASLPPDSWLP